MTFAKRNILRKIPTGPNPPPPDVMALLASKLSCFFDVRDAVPNGGFYESHKDKITGTVLRAPSSAERPIAAFDGANFRARQVMRITNASNRRLVATAAPNIVPVGVYPEVFAVARVTSAAASGSIVGCGDQGALVNSGAGLWTSGGALRAGVGGTCSVAYVPPSTPSLLCGYYDGASVLLLENNVQIASAAGAGVTTATTQWAVGGFALSFTTTTDAWLAAWGICVPALTTAERDRLLEIVRNDWGF